MSFQSWEFWEDRALRSLTAWSRAAVVGSGAAALALRRAATVMGRSLLTEELDEEVGRVEDEDEEVEVEEW